MDKSYGLCMIAKGAEGWDYDFYVVASSLNFSQGHDCK